MQTIITIKPILHRGEEQLAVFFPFEKNIDYAVVGVLLSSLSSIVQ